MHRATVVGNTEVVAALIQEGCALDRQDKVSREGGACVMEYALLTSITVDIVAARSMQWPGPGLSTGFGAIEEGLISNGGRNVRGPLHF